MRVRLPLLIVLAAALLPRAGAAAPAAAKRIEALNTKALAAHGAGESEKARDLLLEAVVLAKQKGLGTHPTVAQTYLHLGRVSIEGLSDAEKGERYLTLALRIDPKLELKNAAAGGPLALAFERARTDAAAQRAEEASQAAAADTTGEGAAAASESAGARKERLMALAIEKEAQQREQEVARKYQDDIAGLRQQLEDAAAREKRERDDRQRAQADKELLTADRNQLQKDSQELRKQLAELQAREKKAEEEKQRLLADKKSLEQRLADAEQRARRGQEEGKRLGEEKVALEKRLADEKAALEKRYTGERQALEKRLADEKAALAKRLGETEQREKQEREVRTKLEEEKRQAQAREQESRDKEKREKLARDKAAEGPPLPAGLAEKLHCTTPEQTAPNSDLFVHCLPQAQLKSEDVTLYYRPSGSARYHSVPMERARTGWYVAMIPAALIKGSTLQYYAEIPGPRGRPLATNGKAASPNLVAVNRWQAALATGGAAGGLVRSSSKERNRR